MQQHTPNEQQRAPKRLQPHRMGRTSRRLAGLSTVMRGILESCTRIHSRDVGLGLPLLGDVLEPKGGLLPILRQDQAAWLSCSRSCCVSFLAPLVRKLKGEADGVVPPSAGRANRLGVMSCAARRAGILGEMVSQCAAALSRRWRGRCQAPAPMSVPPGQAMLREMLRWSPGYPTACPVAAAHGVTLLRTPSETSL